MVLVFFPRRLSVSEVFVPRLSALEASPPQLLVSEVFVPRLSVLEATPPRLQVSEVFVARLPVPVGAQLLFSEVLVLSNLVTVSARYPTPHPLVRLGFRYSCGSSYVRCVPCPNPIQKPKMLQIHLLPLPVPGEGIPLPRGCLSCFLRPGSRFVVNGVTPRPLSGSLWTMSDPL